MKCYKLKLKDELLEGTILMPQGHDNEYTSKCRHLSKGGAITEMQYIYFSVIEGTEFTEDEFKELPSSFVDLLEVEVIEPVKYYIRLPYIPPHRNYINLYVESNKVSIDDGDDGFNYRTKFTLNEIETMFPQFLQFAEKVGE